MAGRWIEPGSYHVSAGYSWVYDTLYDTFYVLRILKLIIYYSDIDEAVGKHEEMKQQQSSL